VVKSLSARLFAVPSLRQLQRKNRKKPQNGYNFGVRMWELQISNFSDKTAVPTKLLSPFHQSSN